ncbi:15128_t:CDS:2 [Gigaspora rosea]|nr:15128_t:CDS:2 [Gigaspora rosea]
MDEIPVWFNIAGNFTVNPKGEKTVHIRAMDNDKNSDDIDSDSYVSDSYVSAGYVSDSYVSDD